jgi:carboxyl-terminal processing protease
MAWCCLAARLWLVSLSLSLSNGYGYLNVGSSKTVVPRSRLAKCQYHSNQEEARQTASPYPDSRPALIPVHNNYNLHSLFRRRLSIGAATIALATTMTMLSPPPAFAANYGSLSDEQKLVAEAWRLVDHSFLDRTFNGQDWFQLRHEYVDRPYETMRDAQRGLDQMLARLGDKYTRYLSPAQYQSLVDSATGTFAGVGVGLGLSSSSSSYVMVTDVEAASPAAVAGLQPGDCFVQVDGTDLTEAAATPDEVAAKLRGPKGSKVSVTILRSQKKIDYILTREPITITAVRSYVSSVPGVNGKVGVVRIKNFSGTTATTVAEQLERLRNKGASQFVLDLRGNPGGLLPGGVDTASLFLEANAPVVFVVNKSGVVDAQQTLTTGFDLESPLVVLVDSNTASAAEVCTAALQENGRATVAGENTFGKGIVQTVRELSNNNGGVAITVARYETPQHHDINKQGIVVDVPTAVSCAKDDATACLKASVFQKPRGV